MCRNIRTLHNFEPPVTREEIHAAALQYVRKVSGFTKPSAQNSEAFEQAIEQVARATETLMGRLITASAPKNREQEAEKARKRWQQRAERLQGSA